MWDRSSVVNKISIAFLCLLLSDFSFSAFCFPTSSFSGTSFSAFPFSDSSVGIYGSIKGEDCELIVLQHYTGARSLYIQVGRRDIGRKTAPPSRCSGTQSCPDATSGPSCPDATSGLSCPDATSGPSSADAHYSDSSPRTEDAKEHRRE